MNGGQRTEDKGTESFTEPFSLASATDHPNSVPNSATWSCRSVMQFNNYVFVLLSVLATDSSSAVCCTSSSSFFAVVFFFRLLRHGAFLSLIVRPASWTIFRRVLAPRRLVGFFCPPFLRAWDIPGRCSWLPNQVFLPAFRRALVGRRFL